MVRRVWDLARNLIEDVKRGRVPNGARVKESEMISTKGIVGSMRINAMLWIRAVPR